MCITYYFFFFQAEDGIRDYKVTGVQTCALPIWRDYEGHQIRDFRWLGWPPDRNSPEALHQKLAGAVNVGPSSGRSEERRVGKSVDLGGRRIIKKKKKKCKSVNTY